MIISEQPGRIFAIFVLSPYLIFKGYQYCDKLLISVGIIFIIYEIFWILNYKPNTLIN